MWKSKSSHVSKCFHVASRTVVAAALAVVMQGAAIAGPQGSDTADIRPTPETPTFAPDGLDRGEKIRTEVEKWQDRVRRKIEALDKSFQELDLRKIEVQKLSRERFEEILDDLDEESELILRAFADVQPDVKLLRQTLEKAPGVFRQIAIEFEEEAARTEDGFFREAYADLAAASNRMAANCEQKAKGMDGLEKELQAKLKFVETSQGFCHNIRRFLRTIPTEDGIATEKWIERVNQYVAALEQSVKLLKTMTQGMDQKPTADPKPVTKPSPSRAEAPPALPRKPLSLGEARARLVSLKN